MRLEYFQMLDEIERLDRAGEALVARSTVPLASPVFEGHFPGHAIVPGVLLLETMAQAAGYLLLALDGFSRMPFLANVKQANFRAFVLPGEQLTVEARRIHAGSGYAVMQSHVMRDADKVCDARLMCRTLPFPAPALAAHVLGEGRRLGFVAAEGL